MMTISLIWFIVICALCFCIGLFVNEIMNNRLEKAFNENLKELEEIRKELQDD